MASGVPCPSPVLEGWQMATAGMSRWQLPLAEVLAGWASLSVDRVALWAVKCWYLEFKPNRFGEPVASGDLRTWRTSPTGQEHDWSFGCVEAKPGARPGTGPPSELMRRKETRVLRGVYQLWSQTRDSWLPLSFLPRSLLFTPD